MSPRRKRKASQILDNIDGTLDLGIKLYRFLRYEARAKHSQANSVALNDPYRILGFTPQTPVKEKKRRYRQLQMLAHPDHHGDQDLSALINGAWEEVCKREKIK